MDSTHTAAGHGPSATPARTWVTHIALTLLVSLLSGAAGFYIQTKQNQADAQEHIAVIAKRGGRQISERMQRYEYGLRGARGVTIAADGPLTRAAFSRYAVSRQIDTEFPGARGFGVVLRVPEEEESFFLQTRRQLDAPDFSIRRLSEIAGDRFVIPFVEPQDKNKEALGLDIGSEPARRSAALLAARSREATLTAPLTLVQASGRVSGGMLLLLPIFRNEPRGGQLVEHLIGWSYAPLLMEE